jgi:hypothetical protein
MPSLRCSPTFKIPRQIHQKLLEIANTKGTSQQELLTQALAEWLSRNGAPDLVRLYLLGTESTEPKKGDKQ